MYFMGGIKLGVEFKDNQMCLELATAYVACIFLVLRISLNEP